MNSAKLFSLLLIIVFSSNINCNKNDPDYEASLDKIIEHRGFNYEKHYIETKDGYILGVYRLINPFVDQSLRSKLKPIVLQHGFLGTGADFLINSPGGHVVPCNNSTDNYSSVDLNSTEKNNLGFFLANLCYDVWISNSRGNGYSRNHTTFNPDKDAEFWKYTIDELITYDTPAVIDYILKKTKFSSLGWIGHSQGTTIMFGLLSEKPEYSAKVKPFIGLAPVFYVQNMGRAFKIAARIPGLLFLARTRGGELSKSSLLTSTIKRLACSTWNKAMCNLLLYPFLGYDMNDVNASRVDIYSTKIGSSASLWNMVHFGQNINSDKFHKFDFGKSENKRRYGQAKPPIYDLSKINSTSIALLYSKGDALSDYADVSRLIEDIQVPLVRDYCVPLPSWNHYDFIFAKETYKYINSIVADILSTF